MRSIYLHIFIVLLLSTFFVSAQTVIRESENEYDKKYTPAKGSIFNDLGAKRNPNSSGNEITTKNCIKFIPTAMFRQKLLFTYQREIYNGFSGGLVLGKAFGRDYLQELSLTIFDPSYTNDVLSVNDMISSATYDGSSPYVGLNLRGYFSGKSFDGGFIELSYGFERTDYALSGEANGYAVKGNKTAEFKMSALGITFGGTYNAQHFSHEFYMTCGVKLFRASQFVLYRPPSSPTSYGNDYYYKSSVEKEMVTVMFGLGYALGFGF